MFDESNKILSYFSWGNIVFTSIVLSARRLNLISFNLIENINL